LPGTSKSTEPANTAISRYTTPGRCERQQGATLPNGGLVAHLTAVS
jgi:hypothetical protein